MTIFLAGYDGWKKVTPGIFIFLCLCRTSLLRPQQNSAQSDFPTWDNLTVPVSAALPPSGDIRLVGDSRPDRGNVQLKIDDEWRCICDDGTNIKVAQVVCRQLGFLGARSYKTGRDNFGTNRGSNFWLDQVNCKGDEPTVLDCRHDQVGKHNCGESECLGVICDIPRQLLGGIKLEGGAIPSEGNVMLNIGGNWFGICDNLWGPTEALVACRQLGFVGMREATVEGFFGTVEDYALDKVMCVGGEDEIVQCGHKPFMDHNCRPTEAAGVRCIPNPTTTTSTTTTTTLPTTTTTATTKTTTSAATNPPTTTPMTTMAWSGFEPTVGKNETDVNGGTFTQASDVNEAEDYFTAAPSFGGAESQGQTGNSAPVVGWPAPEWQGRPGPGGGQDGGQNWPGQEGGQSWPGQEQGQSWPGQEQGQSWPGQDQGPNWQGQGNWQNYGSNEYGNYGSWQG